MLYHLVLHQLFDIFRGEYYTCMASEPPKLKSKSYLKTTEETREKRGEGEGEETSESPGRRRLRPKGCLKMSTLGGPLSRLAGRQTAGATPQKQTSR